MDVDAWSQEFFGRLDALGLYHAITRLPQQSFTTGELIAASGVASASCSKELRRLVRLGLLRPTARRGQYERAGSDDVWELIALLHEFALARRLTNSPG